MSNTYDLALLNASGQRLPLPTNRATGVTVSTGPRGFQDAQAFIPLTDAQADQLVQTPGLRMKITDGAAVLWEGRAEDIALRNGGVQLGGLGDTRLLDDITYTALWSDANVTGWIALNESQAANNAPGRYTFDTNNRIYIAPEKNATMGSSFIGRQGYQLPSQALRPLARVEFDFEYNADVNWGVGLQTWDALALPWTFLANVWSVAVAGPGVVSGSFSANLTGTPNALGFYLFYNAAPAVYVGETGAVYLKITNLRVKSTTSTALYADELAKSIRDQINTVNAGALSTSNRLIISPGIDLLQAIYEDMAPSAILDAVAAYGDSAGQAYEWGVFEGRELFFRPEGSAARQWAIDAADLEIEQTLDGLFNSTYGLYQDANGRTLRTAAQTNAQSIGRYGLTRQAAQQADTTSSATAITIAATATAATATPIPRATVKVRRFSTLTGAPARGEWVRSGDTVTIRNLPPTTNTAVDRVRTFRVAQTTANLDTGDVTIIPESPGPDLEFQIAQLLAQ
jgi:hypothetical protein